jgi:carbon-monoxide dehydrogenase medium subunit
MRRAGQITGGPLAALADGASIVGSPLTRNRATIGGNVCRSSPAGDTLPPLLVLDAKAHLASIRGHREVGLAEFFTGPGLNVMAAGEILLSLELPRRSGGSAYRRLTYRKWMDLAVVGVAAWVVVDSAGRCRDAAVAFGGAAPTPRLVSDAAEALRGTGLDDAALDRAAAAVVAAASPIHDVRGSISHRLRGLETLTRRVIRDARRRADETRE